MTECLLSGLRATARLNHSSSLDSEKVRSVAAALGLSDTDLIAAIDGLSKIGALRLSFGGTVEVLEPPPITGGDTITIHVGGNISAPLAVGRHAVATGDIILGRLAASRAALAQETGIEAEKLQQAVDHLAEAAKEPKTAGALEHLQKANTVIEEGRKLGGNLGAIWTLLRGAYDLLMS